VEYKILITLSIEISSPLKTFIGQTDIIRGEPCSISLSFKNIGTETFPGGKIQSLKLDYSPVGTAFTVWTEEWNCPPLSPENEQRVVTVPLIPIVEGLAWIRLNILAQDGQIIQCYQSIKDPLQNKNAWAGCIYVNNRELLQIINLLSLKKGG
jgi:hypothetical protein